MEGPVRISASSSLLVATMNQKSSLRKILQFVSQALTANTPGLLLSRPFHRAAQFRQAHLRPGADLRASCVIAQFEGLSKAAQCLLIRMVNRRGRISVTKRSATLRLRIPSKHWRNCADAGMCVRSEKKITPLSLLVFSKTPLSAAGRVLASVN
jgi:hypothetical protein